MDKLKISANGPLNGEIKFLDDNQVVLSSEDFNANYLLKKLNKKNDEFQEDMKNFNDDVSIKSEEFKKEFKSDMDRLGDAIKDVFKKNDK